jgi:hypothetical protein
MADAGITEALTFDQDFEQAGFKALMVESGVCKAVDMGNKSVGRHGLHIFPFQPPKMIFYSQLFFKQPPQLHWPKIDIP